MTPAASITDVCRYRAAHPALVVRLVHVAPAAERARHLKPIAPKRNRARAAARRRRPSYLSAGPRRATTAPAQRRGARARAHTPTHARTRNTCAKMLADGPAKHTRTRTRTHACPDNRARAGMRAHTRTCARTKMRAQTLTQTHGPHTSAWTLPPTRARPRTRAQPRAHAHTDRSTPTLRDWQTHNLVARTHIDPPTCANTCV
jgi:hypothetical protein